MEIFFITIGVLLFIRLIWVVNDRHPYMWQQIATVVVGYILLLTLFFVWHKYDAPGITHHPIHFATTADEKYTIPFYIESDGDVIALNVSSVVDSTFVIECVSPRKWSGHVGIKCNPKKISEVEK